jgi:hypothetical protein
MEAHCPGNIASVTPRVVAGALIVVPVSINHAGPFDFLVDTGSQLTVIDPALASQLGLKAKGTVGLVSSVNLLEASVAVPDTLEVGAHMVEQSMVAVQELRQLQAADPRIRGVLGENFLGHFDFLIDYRHKLLCLDEANRMQAEIRGERIPLMMANRPKDDLPFAQQLVLSVRLPDTAERPVLLQLDAGEAQPAFAVLPPQDMRLGTHTLRRIRFVTPVQAGRDFPDREEDGILPAVLFDRVYVNNSDHYVVFDWK